MTFYDDIADEFAQSRQKSWGEFTFFEKYLKAGQKILDIGCGSGRLYDFLKEKGINYTGCDSSSKMLAEAEKKHPRGKFLFGDFRDLPFEDHSFHVVFAIASFHHLMDHHDQNQAAREINRVLKKDGLFCLTVWNLFQKKYRSYLWRDIWPRIKNGFFPWGVYIPFGSRKIKRSYYAFTPNSLKKVFQFDFLLLEEIMSSGKKKQEDFNCRNFCFVFRKKTPAKKKVPSLGKLKSLTLEKNATASRQVMNTRG